MTTYEQRIDKLFHRFPSVQSSGFGPGAYKPGLERMQQMESLLGRPSENYKIIHVAGTNGKGSVSNMLCSALCSLGYKTGLFTSPHIHDFRERMRINGKMISREEVVSFLDRWEDVFDKLDLSFFEITTALALDWFSAQKCDYVVLETGLGGRLDSTNIVQNPSLSVITSIGLDHCALLGDTREKIAAEKAGIFKPGTPAVVSTRDEETAPVFERTASSLRGCTLTFADSVSDKNLDKFAKELLPQMDLFGPYQCTNLRTTLVCLKTLDLITESEDPACSERNETIKDGIRNTAKRMDFHGRWEKLHDHPLVLCDIGHNPPALSINFAALDKMKGNLHIVYGIMADKDLDSILPLMPVRARYYFCAPDNRRAMDVDTLALSFETFMKNRNIATVSNKYQSVADAVNAALSAAGENDTIYIGGSTFVLSEATSLF